MENRLMQHLLDHGLKKTRQRQALLEVFHGAGGHVTLDDLFMAVQKTMPQVGFATVYRTMKLFVDAGIATEHRFGSMTRYEVTDAADEHHDHLICVECGRIMEFHDEVIENRQDEIALKHRLHVLSHRHNIFGRCMDEEDCQERKLQSGTRH